MSFANIGIAMEVKSFSIGLEMGVVLLPILYKFSFVPNAVCGLSNSVMTRTVVSPVTLGLLGLCWSLTAANPLPS